MAPKTYHTHLWSSPRLQASVRTIYLNSADPTKVNKSNNCHGKNQVRRNEREVGKCLWREVERWRKWKNNITSPFSCMLSPWRRTPSVWLVTRSAPAHLHLPHYLKGNGSIWTVYLHKYLVGPTKALLPGDVFCTYTDKYFIAAT